MIRQPDFASLPENLIISPGGVATTFLIDHVKIFVEVNDRDDLDGFKHLPYLPRTPEKTKILFITGDSNDIYRSLRRRGYTGIQSAKLGCVICQFCRESVRKFFLKRAIARQLARFKDCRVGKVLIVDYSEIWDAKTSIAKHFRIEDRESFCKTFPARKDRKSK